jgi:hypothetical protein
MTDEQMLREPPARARKSRASRFWLPFAGIALLFSGLAIAYATNERVRDAAPGAIRQPPAQEDTGQHGLELEHR